jgi:hypothetical protein
MMLSHRNHSPGFISLGDVCIVIWDVVCVFCDELIAVALCLCCAQDGVTALFRAANNGRTDCLQLLLENGADAEVKDNVRVIFGASEAHM